MKHIMQSLAISLFICTSCNSQQDGKNDAAYESSQIPVHGMNMEALAKSNAALKQFVDKRESPGMVTLVARNGKIASLKAMGWRLIDEEPMETTDVFSVASVSKPFVKAGILMLVEENKLSLDDLVEDHLPEFKGQKVQTPNGPQAPKNKLTVRHLITITDALEHNREVKKAKSIKERALKAATKDLLWEPGSKRAYPGNGLYVAAYLIEKYSGMSYVDFTKARILKPLGMKNTYFTYKNVPEGRVVPKHRLVDGKWKYSPIKDWGNKYMFAVDAGLLSTAEDLFMWYQMILNGGEFNGVRILSKEAAYSMTHGSKDDPTHSLGFKLGFGRSEILPLTEDSWGKGGAGGTTIWVEPSTKSIYMMLHYAEDGPRGSIKSTFLRTAGAAAPRKNQD